MALPCLPFRDQTSPTIDSNQCRLIRQRNDSTIRNLAVWTLRLEKQTLPCRHPYERKCLWWLYDISVSTIDTLYQRDDNFSTNLAPLLFRHSLSTNSRRCLFFRETLSTMHIFRPHQQQRRPLVKLIRRSFVHKGKKKQSVQTYQQYPTLSIQDKIYTLLLSIRLAIPWSRLQNFDSLKQAFCNSN